jgi:molecular chaperone GrpE
LREKVEALNAELATARDQLLRALADSQNLRKRFQSEAQTTRRHATEQLVRELLPVLDNFERTLAAAEAGASLPALVEGVKSVDRQMRAILENKQFRRIAAEGEPFDPNVHEAVATQETHELPEGTVLTEIEPGYKLADTVIRPAKVKVSKKP